jgi:hypothetical protein
VWRRPRCRPPPGPHPGLDCKGTAGSRWAHSPCRRDSTECRRRSPRRCCQGSRCRPHRCWRFHCRCCPHCFRFRCSRRFRRSKRRPPNCQRRSRSTHPGCPRRSSTWIPHTSWRRGPSPGNPATNRKEGAWRTSQSLLRSVWAARERSSTRREGRAAKPPSRQVRRIFEDFGSPHVASWRLGGPLSPFQQPASATGHLRCGKVP